MTRPLAAAALGLVLALAGCGKYGPPVRASRLPPRHPTAAPAAAPQPAPSAEPQRDDQRDHRRDDETQP